MLYKEVSANWCLLSVAFFFIWPSANLHSAVLTRYAQALDTQITDIFIHTDQADIQWSTTWLVEPPDIDPSKQIILEARLVQDWAVATHGYTDCSGATAAATADFTVCPLVVGYTLEATGLPTLSELVPENLGPEADFIPYPGGTLSIIGSGTQQGAFSTSQSVFGDEVYHLAIGGNTISAGYGLDSYVFSSKRSYRVEYVTQELPGFGDVNEDGSTTWEDVLIIMDNFGDPVPLGDPSDCNGDSIIDWQDLECFTGSEDFVDSLTESQQVQLFNFAAGAGYPLPPDPEDLLSSTYTADYDLDGDVDGSDFLKWQRGESPSPVASLDLALWVAQYGMNFPLGSSVAHVPEPCSFNLLALAFLLLPFRPRGHVRAMSRQNS